MTVEVVVEVPRPHVLEQTREVPKVQVGERIARAPTVTHTVIDQTIQNQAQPFVHDETRRLPVISHARVPVR